MKKSGLEILRKNLCCVGQLEDYQKYSLSAKICVFEFSFLEERLHFVQQQDYLLALDLINEIKVIDLRELKL